MTKQLELEKASGELSSVELRNLRERNVKLEGDMKSWSERCAKLEEQLKNRDSAVSKSIEAGDAANRELAAEIKALKQQLATQNRELKVLLDQKSSQEKALAAASTGVQLLLIRRPEDDGLDYESVLARCREMMTCK